MTRARHETPPSAPGAVALSAQMSALVPVLRTDRLVLRGPALSDFPVWADILCGPRGAHVGGPMTRDEAWADFLQLASGWYFHGHGGWTITQNDVVAGFVLLGLEPGDAEPELGFLITGPAEGQGIAFEAASAARAYAAGIGLTTLVSYIDPANTRSRRLAERLGAGRDLPAEQALNAGVCIYRHPIKPEV